ncbi:MAG: penicillin-insensitive murein endopeptidase [Deltaproteobacteria bacterium]|nr:penicillin-insensitive murein endopeptidase [Deltaproteobacteria bacterium]
MDIHLLLRYFKNMRNQFALSNKKIFIEILAVIGSIFMLSVSDPFLKNDEIQNAAETHVSNSINSTHIDQDEESDEISEEDVEGEEDEEIEKVHSSNTKYMYSTDISDEMLQQLFSENPKALGSICVGFANLGRLINGVKFPEGDAWVVVNPQKSYGTEEVIKYIITAAKAVKEKFPDAPPLRINDLSAEKGGYIRPHKSHQNGRDVDIGFYYKYDEKDPKKKIFDLEKNWEFIKAVITKTDVQVILVDKKIQKQLYEFAKSIGENEDWLNSIFNSNEESLIKHAKRHKGHFHIRFYSPRAQELGKRIHPILDKAKAEERVTIHKVKRGECLGKIAMKYNSSINLIKKANRLKSHNIRAGTTLLIPLLGPCHHCPEPPDVVIPKRRLPEDFISLDKYASQKITKDYQIPLNFYFNFYHFTRINNSWLKLDKY